MFMIVNSRMMSQIPRVSRKVLNSRFPFRWPTRNAEVPARNTKTGAQKCVIQRVTKMRGVRFFKVKGIDREMLLHENNRERDPAP